MMSLPPMDLDTFESALKIWDRPEQDLGGTPLDADADTDAFIDAAFGKGRVAE
jgi:hypothetical protein